MPRIPLIDPNNLTPEQSKVYNAILSGPRGRVRGPMLVALHQPELAEKWQEFGELLRYRISLPALYREIAILVTAQRWYCELEWHLHKGFALDAGVSRSIIDKIQTGRRPEEAKADELAVYDFVAELHDFHKVRSGTYQKILDRWGIVGTVELTALVGYYTLVAMTLNAHELPLPEGVEPSFDEASLSLGVLGQLNSLS